MYTSQMSVVSALLCIVAHMDYKTHTHTKKVIAVMKHLSDSHNLT